MGQQLNPKKALGQKNKAVNLHPIYIYRDPSCTARLNPRGTLRRRPLLESCDVNLISNLNSRRLGSRTGHILSHRYLGRHHLIIVASELGPAQESPVFPNMRVKAAGRLRLAA